MLVLDISVDLGPGASPAQLESVVRGIRVAVDVGREAELGRIRRTAAEQMKFPTDEELASITDRSFQDNDGPAFRARRLLEVRASLAEVTRTYWRDYPFVEVPPRHELLSDLRGTGYERLVYSGALWPAVLSAGLDVIDPALYQALVADRVRELMPDEVVVRRLAYRNPVTAGITAGEAAGALEKAAGVIDTSATLRSRMRIKRAEADVAGATVHDRIEESGLRVELLREQVREAHLQNDIRSEKRLQEQIKTELMLQDLEAKQIQNSRDREALNAQDKQRILYDRFTSEGQLDEADAVRALPPGDAAALVDLGLRQPELEWVDEADSDVAAD